LCYYIEFLGLSSSVDPLLATSVTTTTSDTTATGTPTTANTTASDSSHSNEYVADHPLPEASDTNAQLSTNTVTDTPQ